MAKFAFIIFTGLTFGAGYLTAYNIGVKDAGYNHQNGSVRSGSTGHSHSIYYGGK